jgi:hypothetical protein
VHSVISAKSKLEASQKALTNHPMFLLAQPFRVVILNW